MSRLENLSNILKSIVKGLQEKTSNYNKNVEDASLFMIWMGLNQMNSEKIDPLTFYKLNKSKIKPIAQKRLTSRSTNKFDDIDAEFNDEFTINYEAICESMIKSCNKWIKKLATSKDKAIPSVLKDIMLNSLFLANSFDYNFEDISNIFRKIKR